MAGSRKSSSSFFCLIQRTLIWVVVYFMFWCLHRFEVNHWHLAVKNVRKWFFESRWTEIYATSLWKESVDQTSIRWSILCIFLLGLLSESEGKAQRINWKLSLSSVDLQNWGEETLWKEESRDPVKSRLLIITQTDKINSLDQILEPRRQRFHRRIRFFLPSFRHLIQR